MKKSDKNVKKDKSSQTAAMLNTKGMGQPDTVTEMLNKYGTYEVQATADSENQYPAIAQGFNAKAIKTDCIKRKREGTKP